MTPPEHLTNGGAGHIDQGAGMTREVRWERMFPDELEAAFAACPVVYLTYGLCEPHGPQNALGLDGLKAHAIACKTAQQYGGIVAPPYYWHIFEQSFAASWAHEQIGQVERTWLSSIPLWQFYKNTLYHLRTAEVLGFHAALVLWGHDGGTDDLRTFLELVQPHVGARLYGCGDWEANTPGFDGTTGDHAGKVETSLLWALQPECVDVSRFPKADEAGPFWAMGSDAREANRRVGERMVADQVRWLGAKAQELLSDYERAQPHHPLKTYEDVEDLWERVIRPALKGFSRAQNPDDLSSVPTDSIWYPNWHIPDRFL